MIWFNQVVLRGQICYLSLIETYAHCAWYKPEIWVKSVMMEMEGKDFRWCCYDRPGQRLKCVALICSLVQAAELIRLVLVS